MSITDTRAGHNANGTHAPLAGAGPNLPDSHIARGNQPSSAVGDLTRPGLAIHGEVTPKDHLPVLADPLLALSADVLDDLERVRIANENRLRQLMRTSADADGEQRGFGLDARHPDVARLAALVTALKRAEHDAELNLTAVMRRHPLGPWIQQARGVGLKQGARLLAAIGDPAWNEKHSRPRKLSELYAYCGYHVGIDGRAVRRQRGLQSNWSPNAKKRAYLIATSIVKAGGPYRLVYDAARFKYAEATHKGTCVSCGTPGTPVLAESPLTLGHQHARALRLVVKAVLGDLWRAARRLHEGEL